MEIGACKLHRRAFSVLKQLAEDEQAQVLEWLASLARTAAIHWPVSGAKKLPGDQPLFLVRVNESLRAIVRLINGEQPEVMDLVRQETLALLASLSSRIGPAEVKVSG